VVLALAAPRVRPLAVARTRRTRARAEPRRGEPAGRAVRLAEAGLVAFVVAGPASRLAFVAEEGRVPIAPLMVATALAAVPLMWLVWPATHGRRPVGAPWLVAAVAAVLVAGTVLTGSSTLLGYGWLGLVVLAVAPRPWSWPAFALVVLASAGVSAAYGLPVYETSRLLMFGLFAVAPVVLFRLVAAVRELETAQAALAEEAVVLERARIDDELRRSVGTELLTIVERGERASAAALEVAAARELVDEVIGASRRALARARRLVTDYRGTPVLTELDTAVGLLRGAGIHIEVVLPPRGLDPAAAEALRVPLRDAVARLLRGDTVGSWRFTVVDERRPRLVVEPADAP
jgi:signal transduction histidine kinase